VSRAKTERLVNLTIALMATSRLLTVTEIGRLVDGYDPDDSESGGDAFRRMFERDKEELRELGIPLETEQVDPLYGDEIGYRIVRRDYALADVSLDPDEAAALGLAARFWASAELAQTAGSAVQKLEAGGVAQLPPPPGLEARVDASDPAFNPMYDAVLARQEVRFDYRRPGAEPGPRRLQPWGLTSWHGRWYVGGHDLDRGAARVFRLSRVAGPIIAVGPTGAYSVPADTDVRAMVTSAFSDEPHPARIARVRASDGAAYRLRRDGTMVDGHPDLLDVPFSSLHGFAEFLTAYGPDVVVLEPADLRAHVIARLGAIVAAT
jgi:predicted DNA-binding transcriptional regulator YafY